MNNLNIRRLPPSKALLADLIKEFAEIYQTLGETENEPNVKRDDIFIRYIERLTQKRKILQDKREAKSQDDRELEGLINDAIDLWGFIDTIYMSEDKSTRVKKLLKLIKAQRSLDKPRLIMDIEQALNQDNDYSRGMIELIAESDFANFVNLFKKSK